MASTSLRQRAVGSESSVAAGRVGDDEAGLAGGRVHAVDAAGRGVDHGPAIGGVGVVVEVEVGGAGLIGEAPVIQGISAD